MEIIQNVLNILARQAEAYLQNLSQKGDSWLVLSSPLETDGSVNESARNKLVMCVYNLTRETTISTQPGAQPAVSGGGYYGSQPPIYLNIYLMFMANFGGSAYETGLVALSRLISYFQQNPWLTHESAPDLDPALNRVSLELVSLNASELNHIVGMFGGRYFPAAFYKLRVIPFATPVMQAVVPAARGGGINEQAGHS
jgi:hypothetical protein